jgi:hypothetical protein
MGSLHVVQKHFPEYWDAVEVGLSACATLLLSDIATCTALIYVGPASAGKTTIIGMFSDAKVKGQKLTHLSDGFTPAAFVSHAAQRARKDLEAIDLLPKIKHKVLLTPEMASVFRGERKELIPSFTKITRVLDGEGLQTDSGTHGTRGYTGDFVFAWLGCTTPFGDSVWETMAQLGSRLFFVMLDTDGDMDEEALVASLNSEDPYKSKREECRRVVSGYLGDLFTEHGGVRGVVWDPSQDDPEAQKWVARCALLLARARGVMDDSTMNVECPKRANHVLYNLARGHALVQGRRGVTMEDIRVVAKVAASSMPTARSKVFRALVLADNGELTTGQVMRILGQRAEETARNFMDSLDQLGLVKYMPREPGKPHMIRFADEWSWCGTKEFRDMLQPGTC